MNIEESRSSLDPEKAPQADRSASAGGLKGVLHRFLEEIPTRLGPRLVQMAIMAIIILSVASTVIETVQVDTGLTDPDPRWISLGEKCKDLFLGLEWFAVAVFTVEYILRLWSCTVEERYRHPILGRLRFALRPMSLVDILAILPTYFQMSGFVAVRALRLVRIFRIFKLGHYSVAVRSLQRAIVTKRAELGVTAFIIAIVLVLASTLVYYAEYDAQPDKFSSIPATMWWGIVTLTTVGYGDISPITPLGKLAGGVAAIFGIGIVALPAGILGSAFIMELQTSKVPTRCPHCGKVI